MFQFSGLAARTYGLGSRLFGNLRIKACLTAPRSFSQFSAPFKAFRRQDVPHALFLRLIAPIHHSSRNNRSTCSLFCRYTIGTFFRPLAKPKKQANRPRRFRPARLALLSFFNASNRLAPPLGATFAPLGLTRANRSTFDSLLDKIPKNVTFFEYSCYRSIKLLNSMNSTKL